MGTWAVLRALILALAALTFLACSSNAAPGPAPAPAADGEGSHGPVPVPGSVTYCDRPNNGCPCEEPGKSVECGTVLRRSGSYVACSTGKRTCGDDKVWGDCVGDRVSTKTIPPSDEGSTKALGVVTPCKDNPCDPYCERVVDAPAGIDAGPQMTVTDAGLTLKPVPVADPTLYTALKISPNPGLITVTAIPTGAAPVTNPSPLSLTALLIPKSGAPVPSVADWDLSSYDTSIISATGGFKVLFPIAGTVTAKARVGTLTAQAPVKIVVDAHEVDTLVPAAVAGAFSKPPTRTDPMAILYPYDKTVFPRGLQPPTLQWSTGGQPASAAQITLRYSNAAAGVDFTWARIIPESVPPRFAIPTVVWQAFDQTASGKTAQITIDRVVGGARLQAKTINVTFSTEPLRGSIYYWEINNGRVAKIDAATAVRTPSWLKPQSRCVACHLVSADGSTIVAQEDGGGGPGGAYDALTGNQRYERGGGANWQAVSPTGKWTIWGDSGTLSLSNNAVPYDSLRAALNRASSGGIDTGPYVVNPAFSPDGRRVAYASRTKGWGWWNGYLYGYWTNPTYAYWNTCGWQKEWQLRWQLQWVTEWQWQPRRVLEWQLQWRLEWQLQWQLQWSWQWTRSCTWQIEWVRSGRWWIPRWVYKCSGRWAYVPQWKQVWRQVWVPHWVQVWVVRWGWYQVRVQRWVQTWVQVDVYRCSASWRWGGPGWAWATNPGWPAGPFGYGQATGQGNPQGGWYVDFNASSLWVSDFSESFPYFTNTRQVAINTRNRPVVTFPSFAPDGNWLAFQSADEVRTRNHFGELWITNANGMGQTELKNATGILKTGQLTYSGDQSVTYEPTFNPESSGGYNWLVYTSTRSYGNTVNPCGAQQSCGVKQLWVSAVDKNVTAGTDPSHPGFWLPGQQTGNQNMRGSWAKSPCVTASGTCGANDDCCGYNVDPKVSTASCRINLPVTYPLSKSCSKITPGACSPRGGSCGTDADCCAYTSVPQEKCVAGACTRTSSTRFAQTTFTRDYVGTCPSGTAAVWRFFDWQTVTPSDSKIVFSVQTSLTSGGLSSAPSAYLGEASGAPITSWVGADVSAALAKVGQKSELYLRVTATLVPSSDAYDAPSLTQWRQNFSCQPSE